MSAAAPLRVLVVDDEPAIRRFLRTSLRAEGYEVIEEETGEAALHEIRRREPDLVMLDLGLPRGGADHRADQPHRRSRQG
jgi:two-component system KDP operon response regulator KdpE